MGYVGFYRKFCKNFSTIDIDRDFAQESEFCVVSCMSEKFWDFEVNFGANSAILITPDFSKQFRLYVDASDVAAEAGLTQEIDFDQLLFKEIYKKPEKLFHNREGMLSSHVCTAVF